AISLQLENAVGNRRPDMVELLLPAISWRYQSTTNCSILDSPVATHSGIVDGRLGWVAESPQPAGKRIRRQYAGPVATGIPSGLRARVESCRISLGALETS